MSSYINTLSNALVSADIGLKSKDLLLGPLDILQWADEIPLPMNMDTDTIRVEYLRQLHDQDTYNVATKPKVLVSRTGAVESSGSPLTSVNNKTDIELAMYGDHLPLTKATKMITDTGMLERHSGYLAGKAASDIGKLAFLTFRNCTGTYRYWSNGVANEAGSNSELLPADVRKAYRQFQNDQIPMITSMIDVNNNFSVTQIDPCYVLYVHDDVEIDVIENFTGTLEFVHISQYAGRGMKRISPREIGWLPKFKTRVVSSPFVEKVGDVATASTAGIKQSSGSTNLTYHNVLLGGHAFAFPGLGKVVNAMIEPPGQNKAVTIPKVSGVDYFSIPSQRIAGVDPHGLKIALGYEFWCGRGATYGEGGLLIPSQNSGGTDVQKAFVIVSCASA